VAIVRLPNSWRSVFIDRIGKEVPSAYDDIEVFSIEGVARVRSGKKIGYIDKTGNEVVPAKYDYVWPFLSDGLAKVKLDGKYGYVDKTGKEVIPVKYDDIGEFSVEGLAEVKLDGKYGYIDITGKYETPLYDLDEVEKFSADDLANVRLFYKLLLLFILFLVLLIIGLIKPKMILRWSKKPTRLKVFEWWTLIMLALLFGIVLYFELDRPTDIVVNYATAKWEDGIELHESERGLPPIGAKFILYNEKKHKFESPWKWPHEKRYARKPEEISVIVKYWIGTSKVGKIVTADRGTYISDAEEDYIEFVLIDVKSGKRFDSFITRSKQSASVANPRITFSEPTDESLHTINFILIRNDMLQNNQWQ
jgi:hypothetical protein